MPAVRVTTQVASHAGRASTAKLLLELGADVNAQNRDGWSPLLCAARGGHQPLAALLVARGADPHHAAALGMTAVHVAARRGHTALVRWLLRAHGGNVHTPTADGATPLFGAAQVSGGWRCGRACNPLKLRPRRPCS